MGILHEDLCIFMIICHMFLLEPQIFQTKVVEKAKTLFMSITCFRNSCRL